jgi:outer membrane immunogenic protein
MRKVLLLSAVSIASLGLALTAAQAADIVPEPAPVASFTGFHVGVGGGAGYNFYDASSSADLLVLDDEDGEVLGELIGDTINGDDLGAWYGFGTIEVGFDYQFEDSPFVIGILANYDFNGNSDAQADHSIFTPIGPGFAINSQVKAELDDSWFLGGRLGFVFNNDTLIYGLGGYTWIDGKVDASHVLNINGTDVGGTAGNEDGAVDGWTIGAGIEHLITENLSLKVEYRHDFLDSLDFDQVQIFEDAGPGGTDLALVQDASVDFSRDTVRAVLSWRFNPGW